MKRLFCLLAMAAVAALTGCAHPISMSPDLAQLEPTGAKPVPRVVGLYLPAADKAAQVTTPGGGGDKISYYPYRDLEGGLYKVLGNVFEKVVVVSSPNDLENLVKNNVAWVVQPKIITQSSSDSMLTWPPTFFQVQLACTFTDTGGSKVSEVFVNGTGNATFSEFSSDFALAAKRASVDVLKKTERAIAADPKLK